MKKAILVSVYIFLVVNAFSQVTENVNFDNYVSSTNCDLTNHFYPYSGSATYLLTQLTDSGITGGCIKTTLSQTPASNTAYCSKYTNSVGHTDITSLCFFWDTTLVNPSTFDYGVAIWTFPKSDASHDIHVSVSKNIGFEIRANGTPQTSSISGLIQRHWHKLVFGTDIVGGSFGDSITAWARVYDLDTAGTGTAIQVASVTMGLHDITYATDTAVTVTMQGSRWGGVAFLDSFSFSGYKSADSCIVPVDHTGVSTVTNVAGGAGIFPNPVSGTATISYLLPAGIAEGAIVIRNTSGQAVATYPVDNRSATLQLNNINLPSGVYYYYLQATGMLPAVKKMVVIK